jgi:Kef-type K+ transport system membrane component KefB
MKINRFRNLFFYLATIGVFSVLMIWIIKSGKNLEAGMNVVQNENEGSSWTLFMDSFTQNIGHPLAVLLLQIITIIITARIFSWLCNKINQPVVIGEIIAGIVLGPSLIGRYFPGLSSSLFPANSLPNLQFLSQVGLILFMFVVGMELDLKVLKNKAHEAVVVSHASIILPFALGMGLAFFTYRAFAPQGIKFLSFSLFMGISMSITAFPVLARMVQERGIHKTHVGALVITCAAVDDITAWSALAAVIAIVKAGSLLSALPTLGLALAYLFIMLKLIRPFLKRIGDLHASRENLSKSIVALFLLVLIMSSYATEIIGIHALFGAFMAGTIMPDNQKFKQFLIEKVEDIALVLLLPLFFVFTGLRTQVGLLNDPYLWMICGVIILVAVTGKFAGSTIAARFVGQNWKNSLTIGALMNTRGLVELVALNIGFELGVLTPQIFTMLVLMALVTTFMTAPSLDFIDRVFAEKKAAVPQDLQPAKYRILISFGKPEMGRSLLRLAHKLLPGSEKGTSITALHFSPGNLFNKYKIDDYERESFGPIMKEARFLDEKITPVFRVSENIDVDITEEANHGNYNLLLMGSGHSIFEGSTLGNILGFALKIINPDWVLDKLRSKNLPDHILFDDRTRKILSRTRIPVGVLINKGLKNIHQILIPVFTPKDIFVLEYARMFINNSDAQVTVWDAQEKIDDNPALEESIQWLEHDVRNSNYMTFAKKIDVVHQYDLILVSSEGWKNQEFFKKTPSVLILRK